MISILLLLDLKIEIYFCKSFQMIVWVFFSNLWQHRADFQSYSQEWGYLHQSSLKSQGHRHQQTPDKHLFADWICTCFLLLYGQSCTWNINICILLLPVATVSLSFFFSQSFSPVRNLGIHTFQRIFTHFNLNTFPRVNKCQVENVNSWSPMVISWLSMPR